MKQHIRLIGLLCLLTLTLQPAMAKKTINPKPKMALPKSPGKPVAPKKVMNHLKEVGITATRLAKPSTTTRLYPKGEVKNTQLDSIRKANPSLGKAIGSPARKPGQQAQYGTNQSDLIKSAIKPKKK